jgi:hypothetical protein
MLQAGVEPTFLLFHTPGADYTYLVPPVQSGKTLLD